MSVWREGWGGRSALCTASSLPVAPSANYSNQTQISHCFDMCATQTPASTLCSLYIWKEPINVTVATAFS